MKKSEVMSSLGGKSIVVFGGSSSHRKNYIDSLIHSILPGRLQDITINQLDSQTKAIPIETMRVFLLQLNYSQLSSSQHRVNIIYNADNLSPLVQNTMLKSLEELTEHVTFIIDVDSLDSLLPTIQSRSLIYSVEAEHARSIDIEALTTSSLPSLFTLAESYSQDVFQARTLIASLLDFVRSSALKGETTSAQSNYADFLLKNYEIVLTTNASNRLILENCLLSFFSLYHSST